MSKLIPLEFNKQRIMTTKVLAEEFGTEEGNIQKNFSNNEKRFSEGKHYYKLEGQTLKEFKNSLPNEIREPLKYAPVLYLWTDRGAARHAKILDTDEAWEIYEELEENYFNPKENKPTCIEDVLISSLQEMKAIRGEVQAVKQATEENQEAIQGIRDVVAINTSTISWREDCRKIIVKIAHKLGGNSFIGDVNREVYDLMRIRLKVRLDVKLTNLRRRMAEEGVCKSKREKANYLDVIKDDARLVEGYVSIVKELAVKYKADIKEVV